MKIAIYSRVSTKDKDQNNENQIIQLRQYADAMGWQVAYEFSDIVSGAKSEKERAGFADMIKLASQRKFDVLLFWSLDRLSREGALKTLHYLQIFDGYGIGYKSFTEQYIDSIGIFKDAIIAILATIAKQERIRLSERVKAGLERTRAKGTIVGRKPKNEKLVEEIKSLAASGNSNRKIAKLLKISHITVAKYL